MSEKREIKVGKITFLVANNVAENVETKRQILRRIKRLIRLEKG